MPASKKDLRKLHQRQAAERGELPKPKKAPEESCVCTICKATFRVTKRNVEIKQHQQAKHPDQTMEICFPGQHYEK